MFWFGKNKSKQGDNKKPPREDLIAQAKANAAAARAGIGEDTLEKIRDAMMRRENSALEQARNRIGAADKGRVADHIKWMMDEDKPPKR